MTHEEAKFILQACDPAKGEAEDARLSEALALLENDAALQAWFEQEQIGDRAIRATMATIRPPAGLQEKILASMNEAAAELDAPAAEAPTSRESGKILPFPAVWLAAAAAVVLVAGSVLWLNRPGPHEFSPGHRALEWASASQSPELIATLVEHSSRIRGLDMVDNDVPALKSYLADHRFPTPGGMRGNLSQMEGYGCLRLTLKDVDLNGQAISEVQAGLICLQANNRIYHFYTVNFAERIESLTSNGAPVFYEFGDRVAAVWSEGQRMHVLTIQGQEKDLSPLL